ncbi:hypothetical protein F5B17DRAFT_64724 [Nemania serpens]|nr:hypothetical protein F5B17DRAFT_64724 [Nemania serpens]
MYLSICITFVSSLSMQFFIAMPPAHPLGMLYAQLVPVIRHVVILAMLGDAPLPVPLETQYCVPHHAPETSS